MLIWLQVRALTSDIATAVGAEIDHMLASKRHIRAMNEELERSRRGSIPWCSSYQKELTGPPRLILDPLTMAAPVLDMTIFSPGTV